MIMYLPTGVEKLILMIVNILIVSIPEEIFLVMLCLILLNQFDFLESRIDGENSFKKVDIARIGIIVISLAILSNIFRFYLNLDPGIGFLILTLLMYLLILYIYKLYYNIVDIFKTLVCTLVSVLTLILTEMSYVPLTLYLIDKSLYELNSSILPNFIISLPGRIIQYSILTYLLFKKSSLVKPNILKTITKSRVLMFLTSAFLLINVSLMLVMYILIGFKKILVDYSFLLQIGIIVLVILFPILNITVFFGVLLIKDTREAEERFLVRQDLEATLKDIKRFSNKNDYSKVAALIKDLEIDIKRIYKNYEKEVRT